MDKKIISLICIIILLSITANAYYQIYPKANEYAISGTFTWPEYINDSDLATWGYNFQGEEGNHYGNWSKPSGSDDKFIIEVKDGAGIGNYSPEQCQTDPLRVWVSARIAQRVMSFCWTGSEWYEFRNENAQGTIYEYRVYRNIPPFVSDLNFTDCTDNHEGKEILINLTVFDEDNPDSRIAASINAQFQYYYNNTYWVNFSYSNSGYSSYLVCVDGSNDIPFTMNADIEYLAAFTHRYYLNNAEVGNKTVNITLYNYEEDCNKSEISDLNLNIKNASTFLVNSNILVWMERRYLIDNTYKLVQMDKSDYYGLTTFNVKERDIDYRFKFFDREGNLLKTTSDIKFSCYAGVCEKTALTSDYTGSGDIGDLNTITNLDRIKAGTTDILSINWSDSTGITSNFRVLVIRSTPIADIIVCSENVSAASGQILCNLENYTGDFILKMYRSASPEQPILLNWFTRASKSLNSLLMDKFGAASKEGLFFGFIVDFVFIGAGTLGGVVGVLIMIILSAIVKSWLGFISIQGITLTIVMASISVFAIFLLKRQQNG